MLGGEGEVPSTPGSVSQVPDPGKAGPCMGDHVRVNIHPVVDIIRPERISRPQPAGTAVLLLSYLTALPGRIQLFKHDGPCDHGPISFKSLSLPPIRSRELME